MVGSWDAGGDIRSPAAADPWTPDTVWVTSHGFRAAAVTVRLSAEGALPPLATN